MTREDALNKTIGILTYHQVNFCKSKEAVANMNEIIEALEKIEQEPCDDCVSRQAVLDLVADYDLSMGQVVKGIHALPPATPQPKVGYWEWMQYDGNPNIGNWHCSECHSIGRSYFDFCPFCGTKMSEIPTGQIVENGELYPVEFDDPLSEEGNDKE